MNLPVVRQRQFNFVYANPIGFSGQKAATQIIIKGMELRGWRCVSYPQPVFDRSGGLVVSYFRFLGELILAWARALRFLGARGDWINLNLGQTPAAFIRDAIPLVLARLGVGREHIIISLHGSPFMRWKDGGWTMATFKILLSQAGTITVLGKRQRDRLLSLGLSPNRIVIVVNTAVLNDIRTPASLEFNNKGSVRLLHLSSLIDTKGFTDYLDALALISRRSGPRLEAVLCGKVVVSEFSERFKDVASATAWIETRVDEINRSSGVRVRWVKGASGVDKTRLYEEADIFVLPTRYAVEAQPLVLLEAMSVGCAIVTTRIGEIETILDESSACFLANSGPETLATVLTELINDFNRRRTLGMAAYARFHQNYSLKRHLDVWESLLGRGVGA